MIKASRLFVLPLFFLLCLRGDNLPDQKRTLESCGAVWTLYEIRVSNAGSPFLRWELSNGNDVYSYDKLEKAREACKACREGGTPAMPGKGNQGKVASYL